MNDSTVITRESPEADPLALRLGSVAIPKEGFTASARASALARLQAMGLPHPRDEYWRFTDPRPFNALTPCPVQGDQDSTESPLFAGLDKTLLVFVDGRFDAESSSDLTGDGAEIDILSLVSNKQDHWAKDLYGVLEHAGQDPVKRPHATLNTVMAEDGVLIHVTGKPVKPIHILHRHSHSNADSSWHHVIRVEEGAELTLLETGTAGARSNAVLEIDIAKGGKLNHITARRANDHKLDFSAIFCRIHSEGIFKSFTLSVSGTLMRHEAVINFVGDDAVAHIAAAVLGDGKHQPFHHDDTIFITHGAERCESRQVFKKVLKNGAVGVFQGKILVKPGAQKTDGYQISQGLLLDDNSQFLGKPELEIYADDVKCSHGSTTGAIDETALFYLRSRGVPKERAIVLMILSFLAAALDEVEDENLREELGNRLDTWLTTHA